MKHFNKLFLFLFVVLLGNNLKAQDYTIVPANLNVHSFPGDFFLAKARVQNNSTNTITMFMERIVKNLPPNWTSCFCYPTCIAPFVDTLRFHIAPHSMDSIMPNFGTDSVPGLGTIVVKLYQQGYESMPDTITYTGSTFSNKINSLSFVSEFSVYPNPFSNTISVKNKNRQICQLFIYNLSGEVVYQNENFNSALENINLMFLEAGIYFLKIKLSGQETEIKKLIKTN